MFLPPLRNFVFTLSGVSELISSQTYRQNNNNRVGVRVRRRERMEAEPEAEAKANNEPFGSCVSIVNHNSRFQKNFLELCFVIGQRHYLHPIEFT